MTAPSFPRAWPTAVQSGSASAGVTTVKASNVVRLAIRILRSPRSPPVDPAPLAGVVVVVTVSEACAVRAFAAPHLQEADLHSAVARSCPTPRLDSSGGPRVHR